MARRKVRAVHTRDIQGAPWRSLCRLSLCLLLLVSQSPALGQEEVDPWRETNEHIFAFNDFFDRNLVRPVANTYMTFLPRVARQGIGNFFSNLNDINVLVNDLLQLKLSDALSDSGRFLINTTVGVVGILDVASNVGLEKNEEDFGQTLGFWGVRSGPYVVLPVFGSSNVRDTFGLILDTVFNPIQYHDEPSLRLTLFILEQIDTRASLLSLDELVTGNRYLFVREAYLQRRQYLVNDGQAEDEFGAFDDDFSF